MNFYTFFMCLVVFMACYIVEHTTAMPGMGGMGGMGGKGHSNNHMDLIVAGIVAKLLQSH